MPAVNYKKLSIAFFALYFFIGLFIYRDYGLNWDDGLSRYNGITTWNYVFNNGKELLHSSERYHGPALETALVGIEKLFGITDSRDILLAHHLADFLFFYFAVITFFFSARLLLGHEKWALLACLALVLSPRIFGDSFFNSKDIGFLAALLLAFYPLLKLAGKPGFLWLFLHCMALGFAIDIRILGIIMIPATALVIAMQLAEQPAIWKRTLLLLAVYPALLFGFVVLFWPGIWQAPGYHLQQAFIQMKSYPWEGDILYMGRIVKHAQMPWHYLPVWIFITTPVAVTLLWFAGTGLLLKSFVTKPVIFIRQQLLWGMVLFFSIAPLPVIIVLKSVVYDAWRHVFFIYPFFVLIAIYGFKILMQYLPVRWKNTVIGVAVIYTLMLIANIVYWHPHQNVYFNFVSLVYFNPINKHFEADYWGLSCKQAMEQLAKLHTEEGTIKVVARNSPANWNIEILEPEVRKRFEFKEKFSEAQYYISHHRWDHLSPKIDGKIVYEIKRFEIPIITVYKIN